MNFRYRFGPEDDDDDIWAVYDDDEDWDDDWDDDE
jgi:hypothetical protein